MIARIFTPYPRKQIYETPEEMDRIVLDEVVGLHSEVAMGSRAVGAICNVIAAINIATFNPTYALIYAAGTVLCADMVSDCDLSVNLATEELDRRGFGE